jgi:hypothetical protein
MARGMPSQAVCDDRVKIAGGPWPGRDAGGSDDLPLEPYCDAEYVAGAVALRRTAALLGRFLPRLGPLAPLAALFLLLML